MKRQLQRINSTLTTHFCHANRGKVVRSDYRANPAGLAQPPQVGRQAVRQIHHRARHAFFAEPPTQLQSRLRIQMLSQPSAQSARSALSLAKQSQSQLRFAQPPAYKYNVAWSRPRTPHFSPASHLAYDGDIDK